MGLLLKVISHLGQLSGDLKDFEKAAEDLFKGNLTRDEVAKLLEDVVLLLESGLIQIPGVDNVAMVAALNAGEHTVESLIAGVENIAEGKSVEMDAKKLVASVLELVQSGIIQNFGGFTKEQVIETLVTLEKGI